MSELQAWIEMTFQRDDDEFGGAPRLKIMPNKNAILLRESQVRELIAHLKQKFCAACDGTGFDPDTLDGRCEYCSNPPF